MTEVVPGTTNVEQFIHSKSGQILTYSFYTNQVALKLGKRGDQVMLTKDGRRVEPTAMAAIYTSAKLVASEV